MDANMQAWREGMRALRSDMKNMGRSFANGTSTLRRGTTESGGSAMAVRTAMETGKVEGMSDAVIITVRERPVNSSRSPLTGWEHGCGKVSTE